MFRGKCLASLFPRDRSVGNGTAFWHRLGVEWFETHDAFFEIKDHAIVSQEISAQNSALQKSCGLVYRIKIEYRRIHFLAAVGSDGQARQRRRLNVFRNAGRSEHAHVARLDERPRLFKRGSSLRQDADGRAGIDDEIQRLANAVDENFAAEKSACRGAYRKINSRIKRIDFPCF